MAMKHRKLFPINQTDCQEFCDPTCSYGCYPYVNFYFLPPPPPPPPPPPSPPLSTDQSQQVPPYVIIIASLVASFFLLGSYYVIILKYCSGWNRHRPPPPPTQLDGQDEEFQVENRGPAIDHPIWYISTIGLQPSIINSITAFKYKKGDSLIEGSNCSVCLSEFQEGETLRLLPKCNHAFHIPCIDTWLNSHTNCPLCRAGIVSNTSSASTPSASNDQSSFDLPPEEATQMEDLESDGELSSNWVSNIEVCENRAETEGEDKNNMIMKNEIQPVRRSVSMDSSYSAVTISFAVTNSCVVESEGNSINHSQDSQKSNLGIVQKQDHTNLRMNRVMGSSSSQAQSLHKSPISMKRSFSCGGRLFSSRHSRNSNSILPL